MRTKEEIMEAPKKDDKLLSILEGWVVNFITVPLTNCFAIEFFNSTK